MRRVIDVTVLLLIAAWLAQWHVNKQSYYPVLKIAAGDEVFFTALLEPVAERRACGEATKRFLEPVRGDCPECKVVYARCERELHGLEGALAAGKAIPHPKVSMPGLHIAVEGDEAAAQASCEMIAVDALRRGVETATCVQPAVGRS
jgi:hypothetical protein